MLGRLTDITGTECQKFYPNVYNFAPKQTPKSSSCEKTGGVYKTNHKTKLNMQAQITSRTKTMIQRLSERMKK